MLLGEELFIRFDMVCLLCHYFEILSRLLSTAGYWLWLFQFQVITYLSFLAHLSRRLIGELIGYSWSGVRPSSSVVVHRRSQCSKIFFSKTAWPIKAKFYVEPLWVGGTKVCSRHLGHMTKMAATPIYGKNPSKVFSRTGGLIFTNLGM